MISARRRKRSVPSGVRASTTRRQPVAVQAGVGADGGAAGAFQGGERAALGGDGERGGGMVEGADPGGVRVGRAGLDGQRALARRRRLLDRVERRADAVGRGRGGSGPASARMIASASPASSLARRVSTLPRSMTIVEVRPAVQRLGLAAQAGGAERAPCGRSSRRRHAGLKKASRGSSRSGMAAMTRPGGSSTGMSFSEWTAQSIRPSSSASSISLVNSPLPPISGRRRSCMRSPVVVMRTSGATRSASAGARAEGGGDRPLHQAGLGQRQLGAARADADGGCKGVGKAGCGSRRKRSRLRPATGAVPPQADATTADRPRPRDQLRRDRGGGGARWARTARVEVLSLDRGQPGRPTTRRSAAWCRRSPRAPTSRRSTGDRARRWPRPGSGFDGARRRRGHRRAGPGRRGDGGAVGRQGDRAGARPAAGRGQPPGGPRGVGAAGGRGRPTRSCCCWSPAAIASCWTSRASGAARGWARPSTTRPARRSTRSPRRWACPIRAARRWSGWRRAAMRAAFRCRAALAGPGGLRLLVLRPEDRRGAAGRAA